MAEMNRIELLRKLTSDYSEIGSLTELICRVEPEERLSLVRKRGMLIEICQKNYGLLTAMSTENSSVESRQLEETLREQILSIVTQDKILLSSLTSEKEELQQLLPNASERHRTAGIYKLHSR